MTGKEKIRAALSAQGTPKIPAVICYEDLYARDHWEQFSTTAWWYQFSPELEHQFAWISELIHSLGQDWFNLPACSPDSVRQTLQIEISNGQPFLVDTTTNEIQMLHRPTIGGWSGRREVHSVHPVSPPQTKADIEAQVALQTPFDPQAFKASGQDRLANLLLEHYGSSLYPTGYAAAPLWGCYRLWGFNGLMTRIAEQPELVQFASERLLQRSLHQIQQAGTLGASGIWIEDCMTDMIHPDSYARINLPYLQEMVAEIRRLDMDSVLYFCGDPRGKLDLLLESGADALALEESKKGFQIDITELADYIDGRCTLLGNLDAIHLLPNASEACLEAEIKRHIAAGRRNHSRFIMSLGSPVTPSTSPQRVRLYTDLVHKLG